MRTRVIKFIATGVFLFAVLAANAQLKVGVNAGTGFPTGFLGSFSKVGFGAGMSAEYLLLEKKVGLGLSVDFTSFGFRYLASSGHTSLAPVAVFAKYYFSTTSVRPFVGLAAGEYLVKITDYANTYPGSKINPGLSPMGGFVFQLSDQVDFNLTAKYHMIFSSTFQEASTINFLGVNAGIALTFGK